MNRTPRPVTLCKTSGALAAVLALAACDLHDPVDVADPDGVDADSAELADLADDPADDPADAPHDGDETAHADLDPPARPVEPLAPMIEPSPRAPVDCGEERCLGTIPTPAAPAPTAVTPPDDPAADELDVLYNLVTTGKKGRGSNSQLALPRNLLLADVDGDGASDLVQYGGTRLFAARTDSARTGILHLYTARPIRRVLTGDFGGNGYDQTCVVTTDNSLACHGISTDRRELWWWFTQGTFVGPNDDTVVADFDGDGRDDVLVYPRGGGAYRMYSVKATAFFAATPGFDPGNLGAAPTGLQLRAGDFDGNGRDDLMTINAAGQVASYTSVWDGSKNTFWWGFTSGGGMVRTDDQVTVARIDDDATDDVVLRDRVTGATRFHRLQWGGGTLPTIPVENGQIHAAGNAVLAWGAMHGALGEPGAANRDDALVYDLGGHRLIRADARWSGTALTYWWAYTAAAPRNHAGWAPYASRPWLVLKCRFADSAGLPPISAQSLDRLIHGGGGLVQYFRDVSYGAWDLSRTQIHGNWLTMGVTNAAWRALPDRWQRAGACQDLYTGSKTGFVNVVNLVDAEGDAGNAGGRVLMTPDSSNSTFLAHEVAHTFGWGHSYDDTTRKNADWSAPGEYFDHWDIMSAMAVRSFAHPETGAAGPEMNAPFKAQAAFVPAHRITRLTPGATTRTRRAPIAAIHRPEANGPLFVRVGANDAEYLTIEYRMNTGWDQGIGQASVLVHRVVDGRPILITAAGGPERLVGSVSTFTLGGKNVVVRVHGFAAEGYTADVEVTY